MKKLKTKYIIHNTQAFTLVELLVVISIVGILMAISIFGLSGARELARDGRRKADLEQIRSALEIYKADCNNYPNAISGGSSLRGTYPPNGASTCLAANTYMVSVPIDPLTTRSYRYNSTGTTYEICAALETGSGTVSCGGTSCGGSTCNYKVTNP